MARAAGASQHSAPAQAVQAIEQLSADIDAWCGLEPSRAAA
jgi:hypothetical protein